MKIPVWIKNADGQYKVNPHLEIADRLHLLKKMPDGSLGCTMGEKLNNPELYRLVEEHRNHFTWNIPALKHQFTWTDSYYVLRGPK